MRSRDSEQSPELLGSAIAIAPCSYDIRPLTTGHETDRVRVGVRAFLTTHYLVLFFFCTLSGKSLGK